MAKPALGRGLGALLGGNPPTGSGKTGAAERTEASAANQASPENSGERVLTVPVDRVRPSALQPRKNFPDDTLRELADSIREQGILQPLIVRARGDQFELIAGERRWRAARQVGLETLPVIVRDADDPRVLQLMLIENLQREGLNPIEEALGYEQLIAEFSLRQEDVATRVGKSRAAVANALRLLKLAPEVRQWVQSGDLSSGHAKVLLGLTQPDDQRAAARRIMDKKLSVRDTETLVANWERPPLDGGGSGTPAPPRPPRDLHVVDLENRLQERFGTKVGVRYRKGKGSIEIRFFSDEDLERVIQLLGIDME